MAALSDYLESGLLQHIFRSETFDKPINISVALTNAVPDDSDTGTTLPEVPSGIGDTHTGYARISLRDPLSKGDTYWDYTTTDDTEGGVSGVIGNTSAWVFDPALVDWGMVSGIAICDSGTHSTSIDGGGNLLMYAELGNPRAIYMGDSVKFDTDTLQISFT